MIYFIKKISAVKIMECIELDNKIKITDVHDLDLAQTSTAVRAFVGSRRTTVLFTVLPTAKA